MAPDGFKYTDALLPHAKNYTNITGAVVQAWRCVRWFTNLCLVDSMNKETGEIFFDPKVPLLGKTLFFLAQLALIRDDVWCCRSVVIKVVRDVYGLRSGG